MAGRMAMESGKRYDVSAVVGSESFRNTLDYWGNLLAQHCGLDCAGALPTCVEKRFLVRIVDRVVLDSTPLDRSMIDAARLCAKDAEACAYWQTLVATQDREFVMNSLRAVLFSLFDLAADESGHHLLCKVISACDETSLKDVVKAAAAEPAKLVETAKNPLGARWVLHLLLSVRQWPNMIWDISPALCDGAAELMMDKHGGWLINECLDHLRGVQNMFIYLAAVVDLMTVARNERGCVILANIMNHVPRGPKEALLANIINHGVCLAQDLYGNYVVQHIFALGEEEYEEKLCRKLMTHLLQLSTQKSGSHVVEKCLASAGGRLIVGELIKHPMLLRIAQNAYGNYVVNAALRVSEPQLRQHLVEALRIHARRLKRHPYGRHVYKMIAMGAGSTPSP